MNRNFLDTLTLIEFVISLMNLEANMTQSDKQELEEHVSDQMHTLLDEIHSHLEAQDAKIDLILQKLESDKHDN